MSDVNFTLADHAERYEYIVFQPDTPLIIPEQPAANPFSEQTNRNDITFTINDRGSIYDYANAYFNVNVSLNRKVKDGGYRFEAADNTTLVNGAHSLIRRLTLYGQDGATVYDLPHANQAINVKNLLEMSPDYAQSVAGNMFYYLDTTDETGAFVQDGTTGFVGATTNIDGFLKRKRITSSAAKADPAKVIVNYQIPLKNYSYFQSLDFNNVVLTGMQPRLVVDIETNQNLLYGSADGIVIIEKMELHLPLIVLRPQAKDLYTKSITGSPVRWTYNRERIEQFTVVGSEQNFKITGVVKPKKAIFWFVNNNQISKTTGNKFHHAPFKGNGSSIGIGDSFASLSRCRLEFADGSYYPYKDYNLSATGGGDFSRLYHDVLEYAHSNSDLSSGTQLTRELFANLYSMVYFDLDYKKDSLVSDSKDMTFDFTLSASGAGTTCFAYILYEQEASYGKLDNTFVITSEVSR